MKASRSGTVAVSASQRVHNTGVYLARHWQLYLIFILPAVVLTLIFKYMPMGGILIAFQDYNPFQDILGSEWVGLEHFQRFMSSPDFQRYLVNTLKLSVYGLLWGFPVPIILAFLLNRIESKKINRRSSWCCICPTSSRSSSSAVWSRVLLSVTGPLNGLLHTSINFMTIPEAFRPIYIISGIWQGAGWSSIMYTASLSNASKDLKEAAMIDGANLLQQIMTVEWPAIKDMVVIQFILQAGNIMSIGFEKPTPPDRPEYADLRDHRHLCVQARPDRRRLQFLDGSRPVQHGGQRHPADSREQDRRQDERRQGIIRRHSHGSES